MFAVGFFFALALGIYLAERDQIVESYELVSGKFRNREVALDWLEMSSGRWRRLRF